NDEMPRNADAYFDWRQNSDLLWLTGIDQEDTYLVMFPDCPNPDMREMLFIKETNDTIATWYGHKYTPTEAFEASGISNVMWNSNFELMTNTAARLAENISLNLNEHDRASHEVPTKDIRLAKELKNKYPLHNYYRAAPTLHRLRSVKSPIEIETLKKAIAISEKAYYRILNFVKPGYMEYQVEAELIHEYISNGGTGHAFQPIIASGDAACTLHYVENNKPLKNGDLLLVDTGCEYANYNSDITRCIPVSGKFSARQKEVYDAVLRLHRLAMKEYLKPGTVLQQYHIDFGKHISEECIKLGLLTAEEVKNQDPAKPLYKKYCVHGISHHLGLDVHDSGLRWEKLEPGMVLTCEPGIYIKEEGIGVRIETNVVITEDGCTDLMGHFPIETEQIEEIMNGR
ncbi:MAG: aminopeptidase P family protein, partial [Bacteroidetes bacterium]|nr:aminopeptidase P family protein [Bacteroidota bacterium]